MIEYIPLERDTPRVLGNSAWGDIPTIIKDIIKRFDVKTEKALEFGTEFGYSTSALANYFDKVIGVDIFTGDLHAGFHKDHYEQTKNNLSSWPNIELVKSDYRDYIKDNSERFDMIHIDIVHTYNETFECGEWAVNHSDIVIFHDTLSFPEIKTVCENLAMKYNLEFHNYPDSHGLGILVRK
jgi:predicted O-methyltransferase YrrM